MLFFIILVYVIIGAIEITPLVKKKKKKDLTVYLVLYTLALVLSVLISIGVKVPSPAIPIQKMVEAVIGKQG
ncbi:MAG: hypothetical protein N4A57_09740 [Anaeromicrobium sp.]|jgi:uncharacterized membrane protein YwzB|uniref:hypothetical protein n=1 Tax=Anaeromicrobium sp. TaxID=1929132 RepID=UPI0025FAA40F|nr:hypothetical protein [Anaeromicrobium sp.]MCT4594536.1 hypothetical protein [Anaeromicrobium sp.]